MDKKELIDKFCLLLSEAKNSADSSDMEVSLLMFKKAVHLLVDANFRAAKELIECYEGTLKYYNFLTESEAEDILEKFVNQDGSKGPKWRDYEEVFRKVNALGGKTECEPHYNKWALYVAINRASSDQNSVILKWVGDNKDNYFEACYELALTMLKDKDQPFWIRTHYKVGQ